MIHTAAASAPPPIVASDVVSTATTTTSTTSSTSAGPSRRRRPGGGIYGRQGRTGWTFTLPIVVFLALFLVAPILLALWVSLSDWTGQGSPLSGDVGFVGLGQLREAVRRLGPHPPRLHDQPAQQLLLRRARGAGADDLGARARADAQPAAQGAGILPDGVLLPLGRELGRDLPRVRLPVHRWRRRQRGLAVLRHRRADVVRRAEGRAAHHRRRDRDLGPRRATDGAHRWLVPGADLVGVAVGPERRDDRRSSCW